MPPVRTPPANSFHRHSPLYQACQPCKAHKVACDRKLPCGKCVKKGTVAFCGNPGRSPSHLFPADVKAEGAPQAQDAVAELPVPAFLVSTPADIDLVPPPGTPQPRMVLGARGQQIYVGSTAAISFLQYLRNTLRHHAGPSDFTESPARETMLEEDSSGVVDELSMDTLDPERSQGLVDHFLEISGGLLNLFTDGQIARLQRRTDPGTGVGTAGLNTNNCKATSGQDELIPLHLILAIGAQSRGQDDIDGAWARMHFHHAQRLIFKDMLQDLSINMVINFMLMAFYLFGACQRNTSALYLGVACRAATVLGLHASEPNAPCSPELKQHRARVWSSLFVLDVHFSTILGRSSSLCSMPETQSQYICSVGPVGANHDLARLVDEICRTLTTPEGLSIDMAEAHLERLRDWANRLPPELRLQVRRRRSALDLHERRSITTNLHTACAYYSSVITVTRPFLVARVSPMLRGEPQAELKPDMGDDGSPDHTAAHKLPQACVGAAVHMLKMCCDAVQLDLLSGNMCILQSWLFGSGLVLGYSLLLARDAWHPDTQEAFVSSRDILQRLSRRNPQAHRNHAILCKFADAIDSYHASAGCSQATAAVMAYSGPVGVSVITNNLDSADILPPDPAADLLGSRMNMSGGPVETMLPDPPLAPPVEMVLPDLEILDDMGVQQMWHDYSTLFGRQMLAASMYAPTV